MAEMRAMLDLRHRSSEQVWPPLPASADPVKSVPSAAEPIKQIATLLAAFQ
jgi:hypothetical protein